MNSIKINRNNKKVWKQENNFCQERRFNKLLTGMKNFLYKFEFFSGFYEAIFFNQVSAEDEKDAIIQIVAFFNDMSIEETNTYLSEIISEKKGIDGIDKNWTKQDFYKHVEQKFNNDMEGYDLMWIKEIDFDLNRI